jgi:hypothetical protein
VREDVLDEHSLRFVADEGHEPVLVAADVEDSEVSVNICHDDVCQFDMTLTDELIEAKFGEPALGGGIMGA